ncbi:MAG: helix-turn-helix domain-containing protein [Nitrososphaera sp.]
MIDVTSVVTFVTSDTVMSCILAFLAGLGSVMLYNKVTASRASRVEPVNQEPDITPPEPMPREHHAGDAVIEAVVAEYTRRLQEYDKVIADLRVRLDIMEVQASRVRPQHHRVVEENEQMSQAIITPRDISQPHHAPSRQVAPHASRVTEPVAVTQHASVISANDDAVENRNGTTDYILKLLAERKRSSREVQQAIGRSREHTSRLMKRLNDAGLVVRDNSSKPFSYAITALGQARLREKGAAVPAGQESPPDRSIPFPGGP